MKTNPTDTFCRVFVGADGVRPLPIFALLLCLAGSACGPTEEPPEAPTAAPIQVRAVPVRRGEINDVLTVAGQTAALSVLRLSSPVAGRITSLTVRPGDHLDKGDVVARVIPLENEAALHGFNVLANAAPLSAKDAALTRRLRADLNARDIPLRVPFAAVVADRQRNPGEQVAPNDVLLELFDPDSLYVLAQVPVESAGGINAGMRVDITSGKTHANGEVAALVSALEPQTLTVPVRISLTSPLQPPLLHAAVECRITVARHPDALLIPRSALISSAGASRGVVMVAVQDHARRREVQLGLRTATEVEVTEGLDAGEPVLAQGQYALPEDTLIEPAAE